MIGQTLALNGSSFTIVGVLPRGFSGVMPGAPAEFYVPMSANSQFLYVAFTSRFHWFVHLMARLKPGASETQLKAVLDVAFARETAGVMQEPRMLLDPAPNGMSSDRDAYRKPLFVMCGVVALVMLIACANLAGLSLARGAARQHELAVRAALGATRARLIRQALGESLLLALLGAGLAIPVAVWSRAGIAQWLAGSAEGLRYDLSLDLAVLGFTVAIALLAALLSGLLPALRAGRTDPLNGLKHRGALNAPRLRAGRILVAAQIALSLLLLTGAGLYLRTLVNLAQIDAGFATEKLLLFQLNIRGSGRANAEPAAFYARVQASLAAIPGVDAASLTGFPLLSGESSSGAFKAISGRPSNSGEDMRTRRLRVGETFFATLGLPILQGRTFTAADDEAAPKAIIVNEAFVRSYLPDINPLGQTLRMWDAEWQIVGVCGDAKFNHIKQAVPPTTYFPFRQMFYSRFRDTHLRGAWFAVRTTVPPLSIAPLVRRTVAAIDADVALANLTTQDAVRDRGISQERLLALLCGALATIAVLLSCIGLYGLMAYHVSRRTSEFGIRMALGAQTADIARPILREALLLAACGIAAGLLAAFAATRLLSSQLYQVQPNDPFTLTGVTLALVAVAICAAWLPARRATRVDPITALRAE